MTEFRACSVIAREVLSKDRQGLILGSLIALGLTGAYGLMRAHD